MPGPSSHPHRIACVASGLGRVRRGIETWMEESARCLRPVFDVELWGGGQPREQDLVSRRIPCLSRSSPLLAPFGWARRYHTEQMSAVPATVWRLRRHRIDLVFCGDPILAWNLKRFRRFHRARIVFSDGMHLSPRWLQDYDGIHLLTPHYLEEARAAVRPDRFSRFFVSPYFVDIAGFRPPTPNERWAARQRLGLLETDRVVMTIGPVGLPSEKRVDHLARELRRTDDPRWMLISIGGDEDGAQQVRNASIEALGERVRFLGSQARENLPGLLHAADLYALGALAEPFSIAILEALASGLPVLHHPYPVTQWITGPAGVSVDMTQSGAAAGILKSLSDRPDELTRLGMAGRQLAEQRYSPAVVVEALTSRFLHLLQSPLP
jgi:glycosyltransferase involved in cell wall biosynthesis